MRWAFILAALFFCCTTTDSFAAAKTAKKEVQIERVVAVKPDGMLQLSSSGVAVLADIVSPREDAIGLWLAEYTLQKEFTFRVIGENRYGHALVESSLQPDLLNDGAAVFYAASGKIGKEWRVAEERARVARRGVWDDRGESILIGVPEAGKVIGEFRVVEGRITRIYEAKTATYLNFGEDWQTDFSIAIAAKYRRNMNTLLEGLKAGDHLRVRGYIVEENGPMIYLHHADNLEKI